MPWKQKYKISLSSKQELLLTSISKSRSLRNDHITRASIILRLNAGESRKTVATALNITVPTVRFWKKRWHDNGKKLTAYDDKLSGADYQTAILGVIADLYRSGCPGKFSPEQICSIISVSCEKPSAAGLPLSHWSLESLAEELKKRDIVKSISTSQLSVFLKSSSDKTA